MFVRGGVTAYKPGRNNSYAGHPNGGTDTSTGVPIHHANFTAAVQMHGRDGFKTGDVIMATHASSNKSVIVLATDVGGMPHGKLDLVDGVATKALGLKLSSSGGALQAAEPGSGPSGYTFRKIGSIGKIPYRGNELTSQTLAQLDEVNTGRATVSDLRNFLVSKGTEAIPSEEATKIDGAFQNSLGAGRAALEGRYASLAESGLIDQAADPSGMDTRALSGAVQEAANRLKTNAKEEIGKLDPVNRGHLNTGLEDIANHGKTLEELGEDQRKAIKDLANTLGIDPSSKEGMSLLTMALMELFNIRPPRALSRNTGPTSSYGNVRHGSGGRASGHPGYRAGGGRSPSYSNPAGRSSGTVSGPTRSYSHHGSPVTGRDYTPDLTYTPRTDLNISDEELRALEREGKVSPSFDVQNNIGGPIIILDVGHYPSAPSKNKGAPGEMAAAVDSARIYKMQLESQGFHVIMTRGESRDGGRTAPRTAIDGIAPQGSDLTSRRNLVRLVQGKYGDKVVAFESLHFDSGNASKKTMYLTRDPHPGNAGYEFIRASVDAGGNLFPDKKVVVGTDLTGNGGNPSNSTGRMSVRGNRLTGVNGVAVLRPMDSKVAQVLTEVAPVSYLDHFRANKEQFFENKTKGVVAFTEVHRPDLARLLTPPQPSSAKKIENGGQNPIRDAGGTLKKAGLTAPKENDSPAPTTPSSTPNKKSASAEKSAAP